MKVMKRSIILTAFLIYSVFSIAQELRTFSGRVTSNLVPTIEKASIHLVNTAFTVATNQDGRFEIKNIPAGKYQVQITAIGYASYTSFIDLSKNSAELNIKLIQDFAQLDQVIVSAEKREQEIARLPISLSVLNSRAVQQFRLWNTKELSGIVPNLISANPGDERNVTVIRGVATTSYDPAVATYIDGVNQFNLDTYIPQLLDIERIEVLRGPQGTLYGRNAMAGVINIITRQPGNSPSGFAEASLGNFNQQRFSAGIKAPVIKDKLLFGLAGLYNSRDGFYTNAVTDKPFDNIKSVTANTYLKWLLNTRWSVTLNAKGHFHRNEGAFPLQMPLSGLPMSFTLAQDAVTTMKDDIFNSSVSVFYSGRSFLFTSQTAYQNNYRYYETPIDADFSPFDAITIINNYGKNFNNVKAYTQEFRFSSPAVNNHRTTWTAGSYLFSQNAPNKQATRFGKDAAIIGSPDSLFSIIGTTKAKSKGVAVYGHLNYQVVPGIEIITGIRYDYEQKEQSVLGEYQKDPDPDPQFQTRPDTTATTSYSAITPKIGLSFHPGNSHLYAIYSRGYRPGGFTGFSSDPSQPPLYPFKPEYSNNFEVGYKALLIENQLRLHAAAFYINVTDVQVPTLMLPDAVTVTRNAGKLNSKGLEFELDASVLKRLELGFHGGYTDATYQTLKVPGGSGEVDLTGKNQVFTPVTTALMYLQYTQPIRLTASVSARLEWLHFGKQYFDLANTISQDPYSLLNTRIGISRGKWDLVFWGRNLADKMYIDYAYEFGALHLANRRTYGGTLMVRW